MISFSRQTAHELFLSSIPSHIWDLVRFVSQPKCRPTLIHTRSFFIHGHEDRGQSTRYTYTYLGSMGSGKFDHLYPIMKSNLIRLIILHIFQHKMAELIFKQLKKDQIIYLLSSLSIKSNKFLVGIFNIFG